MTSIIIPYRDRAEHLAILAPRLAQLLPDAEILVIEQASPDAFNRGKLLNIGALNVPAHSILIMHDVDMVPVRPYPAPIKNGVTQVAQSHIQLVDYLGGVTMFPSELFNKIGGYNNEYWHRAEDNEQMFNLKRLGIPIVDRFAPFIQLNHARPAVEFDPVLWKKAQQPREVQDQLSICKYEEIWRERHDYYTKITVNL